MLWSKISFWTMENIMLEEQNQKLNCWIMSK